MFVVDLASFQFVRRERVLACFATSTLLLGVHYLLLGAGTAAVLGFVAAIRFLTAILFPSRNLTLVFLVAVFANAFLTYAGLLSILSTSGSVLSTVAAYRGNRELRKMMMLGSVFWISHNALAGSPGATALEVSFMISNLVGYHRHFRQRSSSGGPAPDPEI